VYNALIINNSGRIKSERRQNFIYGELRSSKYSGVKVLPGRDDPKLHVSEFPRLRRQSVSQTNRVTSRYSLSTAPVCVAHLQLTFMDTSDLVLQFCNITSADPVQAESYLQVLIITPRHCIRLTMNPTGIRLQC
jgi:hypothetical protein